MTENARDALSLLNLKIARLEYEKQSIQFSRRERILKRKEVDYLKTIRDCYYNSEGGTKNEE